MCTKTLSLTVALLAAMTLAGLAAPASGAELQGCFERARGSVFGQIDDFAVASCDPPCPGQICCSNGACVNSVLACGDSFGALPPSFKVVSSERSHLAGATTQGVLAAGEGRKANVWFGYIAGEAWKARGVAPGYYQLVLLAAKRGASSRTVAVVDREGRTVARLPATTTLKDPSGGSSELDCDWGTDGGCLFILCCHDGQCAELTICFLTFG